MDLELVNKLKKQRNESKRGLSAQYENTTLCQAFYNGNQMKYQDKIQFLDGNGGRKRATVNFNKVQENVDSVVGFMAQNRTQAKYIAHLPASEGQEVYSKNMNALYSFHRENANADQIETDQDADMMICGYGAIETDLSYIVGNATTDPNGEIIKVRIAPDRVGWDSSARKKNILDSGWVYYFDDYDLKDALNLFQNSKEGDFQTVESADTGNETGYVYNPWGGLYDKIRASDSVEWSSEENATVRVYNHQWMEYETFYKAKNPIYEAQTPEDAMFYKMRLDVIASQIKRNGPENAQSDDMFTLDPSSEELTFNDKTKAALVRDFGDLINPVPFKRKVFYTAVYSGSHIFSTFRSISQQGFSVKFKTGVFNETDKIWIGMVNSMMEPARYYNKALTELMFTIAANSKGGVMLEEDAVEDVADFEGKWAKTDAVIIVNSGAISGGKIQEKARGAVPTGLENIITLSAQAISAAGVDPSFLGNLNNEDQSGILFKRRIRQVISKMARYFDSIQLYQKEDARHCADLIRVWVENNNGQYLRITGEAGADQFMQISEDIMAAEYDVSIQEAPQTPEDKQETGIMLKTMGNELMSVGDVQGGNQFLVEALQFFSIDGDVRSRLTKGLQPQDQQTVPMQEFQQLQQLGQQLQSEAAQAQLELTRATAQLTAAKIEGEQAKAAQTQAATVKTLEEASRTGYENDLLKSGNFESANVSI